MNKHGLKVLLITYYWPPSGGAGVQRWLKLIKYLNKLNVSVVVLTVRPENASYTDLDESLEKDIPENLTIYKTKSFEPLKIYERLAGKDKIPSAGFGNVDIKKWSQKLVFAIRNHLFIPDPRKGWVKYAFAEAKKIIKNHKINTIITTSPPHSSQLIGYKLKKALGIKWVADFRDPWTDVYYYKLLGHSLISDTINKKQEKKVIENADIILTVSEGCKDLLAAKSMGSESKFYVIPNGYDDEDFTKQKTKSSKEKFVITYTGTMSEQYRPQVVFDVIKELQSIHAIELKIIGQVSASILDYLETIEADFEYIPPVPHAEINDHQMNADLLLLFIPETKDNKGIVTGKIFEYLASLTPIICIGPVDGDAAKIINECSAGMAFEREDDEGIHQYISSLLHKEDDKSTTDELAIQKYSRRAQAKELIKILS